jgi:hypothetical protein
LIELNRHRDRLSGGFSKEALIYGYQLPRLYTQITRLAFGIVKQGDRVTRTTGVAFVIECADVIGLEPTSPSNVATHWRNIKRKSAG